MLLLTKEQKIFSLSNREQQDTQLAAQHYWYKGLGFGIFVVMVAFSGMSYLNLVNHKELATIALGTAIIGGFVALLRPIKGN